MAKKKTPSIEFKKPIPVQSDGSKLMVTKSRSSSLGKAKGRNDAWLEMRRRKMGH
jgi:hypothetical protein